MANIMYSCKTEGAVGLAAGTAKSVIGVKAGSDFAINLKKFRISYDGVTASAVPVLVELLAATFATNAPGTNSTSTTTQQAAGRTMAAGVTSAAGWTTEPTVLTSIDEWLLTPVGGLVMYDFLPGDEPDSALAGGFVLRCNAPALVNCRATLWFCRT